MGQCVTNQLSCLTNHGGLTRSLIRVGTGSTLGTQNIPCRNVA